MLTRCISGAILAILAFGLMFIGGPILAVVLLLTALTAYCELTRALKVNGSDKRFCALEIIGLAGVVCYYLAVFFGNDTFLLMSMADYD